MKSLILLLIAGIVTAVLLTTSVYSEEDTVFNKENFKNPRKSAPVFSHDSHMEDYELACTECHHVYEDGVLVEDESSEGTSCSECHSLKATKENKINLIKAYHLRCKGCHEEMGSGPVMCGECHKIKK